jgi:hypothetical protein
MENHDDQLTEDDLRHIAKSAGLTLKAANVGQIADTLRTLRAGVMRKDRTFAAHTPLAIRFDASWEGKP